MEILAYIGYHIIYLDTNNELCLGEGPTYRSDVPHSPKIKLSDYHKLLKYKGKECYEYDPKIFFVHNDKYLFVSYDNDYGDSAFMVSKEDIDFTIANSSLL